MPLKKPSFMAEFLLTVGAFVCAVTFFALPLRVELNSLQLHIESIVLGVGCVVGSLYGLHRLKSYPMRRADYDAAMSNVREHFALKSTVITMMDQLWSDHRDDVVDGMYLRVRPAELGTEVEIWNWLNDVIVRFSRRSTSIQSYQNVTEFDQQTFWFARYEGSPVSVLYRKRIETFEGEPGTTAHRIEAKEVVPPLLLSLPLWLQRNMSQVSKTELEGLLSQLQTV